MTQCHYYGARQDYPDPRDLRKVYVRAEIPSYQTHPKVDLRCYVNHVYNQGRLNSCTANAVCAAYGLHLNKQALTSGKNNHYFNPSRLFLYYNTREYETTASQDCGASIRDTIKALNRKGVCKAFRWPYDLSKLHLEPSQSCYHAGAARKKSCKYERLNQDIDQFRACLKDSCPFVFGFKVYESFENACSNGEMPMPTRSEKLEGKQVVLAIGYNDVKRCIIVQNSWGERWGDRGYFYIPYDCINNPNMCFDFWKISFTRLSKPRPIATTKSQGSGSSGGVKAASGDGSSSGGIKAASRDGSSSGGIKAASRDGGKSAGGSGSSSKSAGGSGSSGGDGGKSAGGSGSSGGGGAGRSGSRGGSRSGGRRSGSVKIGSSCSSGTISLVGWSSQGYFTPSRKPSCTDSDSDSVSSMDEGRKNQKSKRRLKSKSKKRSRVHSKDQDELNRSSKRLFKNKSNKRYKKVFKSRSSKRYNGVLNRPWMSGAYDNVKYFWSAHTHGQSHWRRRMKKIKGRHESNDLHSDFWLDDCDYNYSVE